MRSADARPGMLMPIGGAEAKIRDRAVLRRFIEICGGESANIAILPTASQLKSTGPNYEDVFADLGVDSARSIPIREREDANDSQWVDALLEADGLFMTGGNQLRLSTTLGGTKFGETLIEEHRKGLHVGGTSAGAAILSEHMIAFGREGSTPHGDMVTLAPGLGLTRQFIIDQHFRQRDRLGRLLTALSYNPSHVGIGLDEDTAAVIDPDGTLEVCGSGGLTIVDPQEVEFSSMDSSDPNEPVCVTGVRLHVLVHDGYFNPKTRQAAPQRPTERRA
ncbi:MAG: cyanophycinase [Planctomycetota bacterium]